MSTVGWVCRPVLLFLPCLHAYGLELLEFFDEVFYEGLDIIGILLYTIIDVDLLLLQ